MNVIRDTRENKNFGWDFTIDGYQTISRKLDTGDYSIEGFEDKLCIERKRSTGEISLNIGKQRKRWERELVRMQSYEHRYIICEFSEENILEFPENSRIPKRVWKYLRISPQFILSQLSSYGETYGVTVIYAGDEFGAYQKALEIIKNVESTFSY